MDVDTPRWPALASSGTEAAQQLHRLRRAERRILALRLLTLVALAVGGALAALAIGSVPLPLGEVTKALLDPQHPAAAIVRELRGSRVLAAFACGGLLAITGVLLQVLLRNPLADPHLLGISGGAAIGALLAILLGGGAAAITGAAWLGALAALAAVLAIARSLGVFSPLRVVLTGVIVASGAGAVVSLLLALAPDGKVHAMLFWLMGDTAQARSAWPVMMALPLAVAALLPWARDLNLMRRGWEVATSLGVAAAPLAWSLLAAAALMTALAVTTIGSVGFVGLVVPHLMRLVFGHDLRWLLPAAALGGGGILTLADLGARTLIAPMQLPLGVVMALVGVPTFLLLLWREERNQRQ